MVHRPFGGGFIEFLARDALHHVMGKRKAKDLTKYAQSSQHLHAAKAFLGLASAKESGKRIQKRLYCLRHDEVECFTGLCQFPYNKLIMPNKRFIKYWRIQERLNNVPDHQIR